METTRMLGSGEGYAEPADEPGHNPLLTLHLLLQGRYWIAALLALVLGAAGAALGYKLPRPTYSCSGLIQIRPMIASVLFDKSGSIPMYEQYVATQIFFLKDQRCIDLALSSPRWLQEGRSNSTADSEAFVRNVTVERQGESIQVTYTNADPRTAVDGVWSLINAYGQLIDELDPENPKRQQPRLEQLRTGYETQLTEYQNRIVNRAAELKLTPEALLSKYQYKLAAWNQAEEELRMTQQALREMASKHPELVERNGAVAPASTLPGSATAPAADVIPAPREGENVPATPVVVVAEKPLTAQQIALRGDGKMQAWLDQQVELEGDLARSTVGPENPARKAAQLRLDFIKQQITERQELINANPAMLGVASKNVDGSDSPAVLWQNLRRQEQFGIERLESAKMDATIYGDAAMVIRKQQDGAKETQELLDETKKKLEALRVDAAQPGHIVMPKDVGRPIYKDRRVPIAAGSGLGGFVLGITMVVVWGLLDRRLRTIEQARNSLGHGIRVLGMLPSLPKNLEDPAAASFAALCVHHIRMLLQVMRRLDGHPAIAVTSPSSGDGKTSLVLSLALSYAASGKSTLLIDCDMVGAGLTRRVNATIRRRIGQILIRENLITPGDLREALSIAQRTKKKLGEVLVEEGYVEAAQLAATLKTQGETSVGLLDVLRGEVLEDCVADSGTARLWILPVGSAGAEHGVTISPEGFRAVLEQGRKRFDVILVDTGPIPGSIESSVAASQTDGVVMIVTRGEQGPLVKRASEHLRDIGARALGVVFNRATPEDFASSYGAMSSRSVPERVHDKKDGLNVQALGPMASAVVGPQKALKDS